LPSRLPDSLPPLQIVNKRKAKIDFEVPRAGPSGLGSVDIYITTDEGTTWDKYLAYPNAAPPAVNEPKTLSPVPGTVTVALPKDGVIYGFYLVVKSRAGLGKRPPKPGDPPQVRIEADTTLPSAELYSLKPDPAQRDHLLVTWKASDRNLAPDPVTLEWSARTSGPWAPIGEFHHPNTGRYSWRVSDNVPHRVYLRLSVRDRAGNTAIAQTPQPVFVDLVIPEVPIIKGAAGQQ
jgi:hypothetical protein